jgi:hypothetical protein
MSRSTKFEVTKFDGKLMLWILLIWMQKIGMGWDENQDIQDQRAPISKFDQCLYHVMDMESPNQNMDQVGSVVPKEAAPNKFHMK